MWRSLRTAAWLGWQIESNWASPALFALYSIVKPLTSAAILVVIFGMITQGNFASPAFAYMYVGNAFYMYVGAIIAGMAQSVVDDRERFLTLKSMYVAPVNIPLYLTGRGVARFFTTTLSVLVTIGFGIAFLHLQVNPGDVRWGLLFVTVCIGLAMLAMMGLVLASIVLTIAHGSWLVGEAVAAALYLFCGAVFPLDALPCVAAAGRIRDASDLLARAAAAGAGRACGAAVSVAGRLRRRSVACAARRHDRRARGHRHGHVPPLRPHRARAGVDRSHDELLRPT